MSSCSRKILVSGVDLGLKKSSLRAIAYMWEEMGSSSYCMDIEGRKKMERDCDE